MAKLIKQKKKCLHKLLKKLKLNYKTKKNGKNGNKQRKKEFLKLKPRLKKFKTLMISYGMITMLKKINIGRRRDMQIISNGKLM